MIDLGPQKKARGGVHGFRAKGFRYTQLQAIKNDPEQDVLEMCKLNNLQGIRQTNWIQKKGKHSCERRDGPALPEWRVIFHSSLLVLEERVVDAEQKHIIERSSFDERNSLWFVQSVLIRHGARPEGDWGKKLLRLRQSIMLETSREKHQEAHQRPLIQKQWWIQIVD
jgi:hypothetical protein